MTITRSVNAAPGRAWLVGRLGPVATISLAQLFGTSLWFSANSAADDLARAWHASPGDIGWLTSAVQGGFILGTLGMALSGGADRFRASSIFVVSALLGAAFNAAFAWFAHGAAGGAALRFCVGVCLAGIYPMGMKLIVSWAPERTGAALAQLVAMLTLGTALPHALRMVGAALPWRAVIGASSVLAVFGAVCIGVPGDGPQHNAKARSGNGAPGVLTAFRYRAFRSAAFGYFGHMWELYAFWTVVLLFLAKASVASALQVKSVYGLSFLVIGTGALGCIAGGALSRRIGSAKVAAGALAMSCACAVIFASGWHQLPPVALLALMVVWARPSSPIRRSSPRCPRELIGGALTIQNSIGFAITVVSIPATTALFEHIGLDAAWLLVPGPLLGLIGFAPALMRSDKRPDRTVQ